MPIEREPSPPVVSQEDGADAIIHELNSLNPEYTPDHPDRSRLCHESAIVLSERYEQSRSGDFLNAAIKLEREALSLRPTGHPDRAASCQSLSRYLNMYMRSVHDGDGTISNEAITLQREALLLCPTGHPDRARVCGNLANTLSMRFERTGEEYLLSEAILLGREMISLRPPGHPKRAIACGCLANFLSVRYSHAGGTELLMEAINLEREALSLRPSGHPERPWSCGNLSNYLAMHYKNSGDDDQLIESIHLQREMLSMYTPAHPHYAQCCGNLASALLMRYRRIGGDSLLAEAINLEQRALYLHPPGHVGHGESCRNLATCLTMLYRRISDNRFLSKAIELERKAISLCPVNHPQYVACCVNLSNSLQLRYENAGGVDILAESIDLLRVALSACRSDRPDHAAIRGNLANALSKRYECTGDDASLDEAIHLQRAALSLRTKDHPDHALACANLATSLTLSYNRSGDDDDLLAEIMGLKREALAASTTTHLSRASFCRSIAHSLKKIYYHVKDVDSLVEAISLEREALQLNPSRHLDRADTCGSLANSLSIHYQECGDESLLIEAIQLQRETLSLTAVGSRSYAVSCSNLANSLKLWQRQLGTGNGGDYTMAETIDLQRQALSLISPADPHQRATSCGDLASTLVISYKHTNDSRVLEEAFALFQDARLTAPPHDTWRYTSALAQIYLERNTSIYDLNTAAELLTQSLEHKPGDPSEAVYNILSCLDRIWTCGPDQHHHTTMSHAYQSIINLFPILINPILQSKSQLQVLLRCSQAGSDAFVNAVLSHDHAVGLELLELAQGSFWSQRVYRRDPQLHNVPSPLATKLKELLRHLTAQGNVSLGAPDAPQRYLTSKDAKYIHSNRLYVLIREIQTLPGMGRFMRGEEFATLRTVAMTHPVVVLVAAREYFYALIIQSESKECILLPLDLSKSELEGSSGLPGSQNLHRNASITEHDISDHEQVRAQRRHVRPSPINRYLKFLWIKIVQPILSQLGLQASQGHDRPRLHWCPTGIFSSLPLHAAGIYEGDNSQKECCANYVVSSYTPTLTTLLRITQGGSLTLARESLTFTLVAEKRALESHLPLIPGVDQELEDVYCTLNAKNASVPHRLAGHTTVTDTSAAMKIANVVHLACHGVQDVSDAIQSGFCLGDGRLSISHLMDLHIEHGFLAFLSACETAKGSQTQPDQAMHLAAAMLFVGFKSVVATMTSITDTDGPKVAKWFYEELLSQEWITADTVAYALDVAVGNLRDSRVSADRWIPFIHMGA